MEKIFMNENSQKSDKEIIELRTSRSILNNDFVPIFESLNIGRVSTKLLNDVFQNKGKEVSRLVLGQANKDISNIRSLAIKKQLLNTVSIQIDEFLLSCDKIAKKINIELLSFLTVETGQINPVPNAEQTIREKNFYYIETEDEKRIYDALCKICEGYNEFFSGLGSNAERQILSIRQIDLLLTRNSNDMFVPDSFNDYKNLAR